MKFGWESNLAICCARRFGAVGDASDEDLALAILREWPQNQRAGGPWRAEHLRQEIRSLTEMAKELLLKLASKIGENALSAATKYLQEKSWFEWTQRQNREKGLNGGVAGRTSLAL